MLLLSTFIACKAPIEAPSDFNDLLSYTYMHTMDEDDAQLRAGIDNLLAFSEANLDDLREGYAVSNLSQEALDSTGETFPVAENLYGVTLQYLVEYPVESIVYANTVADGMEVYPANYLSYERENLSELDCFLAWTCDTFRYRSIITSSLALGAEMDSSYINELRWLQLESGPGFVQRSWMDGEAESSVDWADMTANFYVAFSYTTPAGTETIAASWAAVQLGDVSLPEDILKNQAIAGLAAHGEDVTAYLDANGVPVLD